MNVHELGVLCQAVRTVSAMAQKHHIAAVKHMTLDVGMESGYVPVFFEKLFPVAIEQFDNMKNAQLIIKTVPGRGLQIRDFGY